MSDITLKGLLQSGAHFGHQTKYWNPKMQPYIFGVRNNVHIINLERTLDLIDPAINFVKSIAQKNNKILFVGTKRTASKIILEEADRCGMPYVNERWLGGMLTNYKTIRSSVRRLEELKLKKEDGTFSKLTKKEGLKIQREIDRLQKSIGGITEMGGLPDALFVVDVKREAIAISEASKMGIPIVGIVDTNGNPEKVDYIIPGNDDAIRSIALFTRIISDACLQGLEKATGLKSDPNQEDGPSIVRKKEKEEDLKSKKIVQEKQEAEKKESKKESKKETDSTKKAKEEVKQEIEDTKGKAEVMTTSKEKKEKTTSTSSRKKKAIVKKVNE